MRRTRRPRRLPGALRGGTKVTRSKRTYDSKDPEGPKLRFASSQWRTFTDQVRAGEFDLT